MPRQFVRPVRSCRSCRQLPSNAEEQRLWSMKRTMLGSISKSSTAVDVLALEKPEGTGASTAEQNDKGSSHVIRNQAHCCCFFPAVTLLLSSILLRMSILFSTISDRHARPTRSLQSHPDRSPGLTTAILTPGAAAVGKIASIPFVRITVEE